MNISRPLLVVLLAGCGPSQGDFDDLTARVDALDARAGVIESDVAVLRSDVDRTADDLDGVAQDVADLEDLVGAASGGGGGVIDLSDLESRVADLETHAGATDAALGDLEVRSDGFDADLITVSSAVDDHEARIMAMEDQFGQTTASVSGRCNCTLSSPAGGALDVPGTSVSITLTRTTQVLALGSITMSQVNSSYFSVTANLIARRSGTASTLTGPGERESISGFNSSSMTVPMAYVFNLSAGTWTFVQQISASNMRVEDFHMDLVTLVPQL